MKALISIRSAAIGLVLVSAVLGWLAVKPLPEPTVREVSIEARQYGYTPSRVTVNRGDTLVVRLNSADVTHGFYLEGYGIDAKVRAQYPSFWLVNEGEEEPVNEIRFVVDRSGKFRYRCSFTCGSLHPFMQGEMIVRPNRLFPATAGTALGLVGGMLLVGAGKLPRRTLEKEEEEDADSPDREEEEAEASGVKADPESARETEEDADSADREEEEVEASGVKADPESARETQEDGRE